jgi:2-aminoethylphosphonate-pyruvate transaminase
LTVDDDIPYLLLTPGPLTTSRTVKQAMLRDYCTWDEDYHGIVNHIRRQLCQIAGTDDLWTSVLMQGSGTFAVEATVGSCLPPEGKLLVLANGAYGRRIGEIASRLGIAHTVLSSSELEPLDPARVEEELRRELQVDTRGAGPLRNDDGLVESGAGSWQVMPSIRQDFYAGRHILLWWHSPDR